MLKADGKIFFYNDKNYFAKHQQAISPESSKTSHNFLHERNEIMICLYFKCLISFWKEKYLYSDNRKRRKLCLDRLQHFEPKEIPWEKNVFEI